MSTFVISLDFEMFWGVADSKTIASYGKNIEGVWLAVPAMLDLFKKYEIHATWATVGMLMCNNYKQWLDMCPTVKPKYERESLSAYNFADVAREHPKLFFARPLVEQVLEVNGQELGSHTYGHFYSREIGATTNEFISDTNLNKIIFDEVGIAATSFVFPRNQIQDDYLNILLDYGFTAYRGNQEHWLYRNGSSIPRRSLARYIRFADDYLPLTGNHISKNIYAENEIINVPASRFLRPATSYSLFDKLNVMRIKAGMLNAARTDGTFHLWWHPHNFGSNLDANINNLNDILIYYKFLNQKYGMYSGSMKDIAQISISKYK